MGAGLGHATRSRDLVLVSIMGERERTQDQEYGNDRASNHTDFSAFFRILKLITDES